MSTSPDASFTAHLNAFALGLGETLTSAPALSDAAQRFCDTFYSAFSDFTVLVRVFGTFSYAELAGDDRAFAGTYLARNGSPPALDGTTPVLTLLGSHGVETDWCARETSRDHRAIPLFSNEFVDEIPMIARLLGELGFPRLGDARASWQYVTRDTIDVNGLFFVGDARTATDERGRRIIPSTDFVDRYGVKTVFGFGGPYTATPAFLTAIVFARQTLPRALAARFAPLMSDFKAATRGQIERGAIF